MKKLFALVLCLVLTVSASAVTFTDGSKVRYPDAVAIMADLGLVNGYTDGTFRPGNNLRRAEAAKLVSLVREDHPAASVARFKDVPANHWAAPYIGYCTEKNIISAEADRFRPESFVTGREFAKMLLVCLGYNGKDYVGAGWAKAVDRDAGTLGIYSGFTDDPGRIISRDEVCLLLYNAMQAYAVERLDEKGQPVYVLDDLRNPMTYMEHRFHIVKFSGVLTGNEYADLTAQDARLADGTSKLAGHTPFKLSTSYTLLGRTVEFYAVRSQSGNDTHYTPIGLPSPSAGETAFTAPSIEGYTTVLQFSQYKTDRNTAYYYNGNASDEGFLGRILEDCSITGIDRNGDLILDVVVAMDFRNGTFTDLDPLTVSAGGVSKPAVLMGGPIAPQLGESVRCFTMGGRYYIP